MATTAPNPNSQNQDPENPKKALTLDMTDKSNNSDQDVNKEADESKDSSENQDGTTAVVSPTGNNNNNNNNGGAIDVLKKVRRAERFGVPVHLSEQEKRYSRAERFGIGAGSEATKTYEDQKTAEDQKRKARAERFGLAVPTAEEGKKKARLARFGSETKAEMKVDTKTDTKTDKKADTKIDTKTDAKADPVEEEKRKARALRFAQPSSNTVPHITGKEDVGSNTAVASNGVGGA